MLVLISPAKKLDFEHPAPIEISARPPLLDKAKELAEILKTKNRSELKSLMNISDNLADLNYKRYQNFSTPFDMSNAKQAILTFQGDTYKGLNADTLDQDDLEYAQRHLRILSGLYGILRPLDLMQPYRLEMGTKLPNPKGEDLYDFWTQTLTKQCNQDIANENERAVINLASQEYISSIDKKSLNAPFITCHFKDVKKGKARVIGLLAKRARGMMARYIIRNRLQDPHKLKDFDEGGYKFTADQSTDSDLVFIRPEEHE